MITWLLTIFSASGYMPQDALNANGLPVHGPEHPSCCNLSLHTQSESCWLMVAQSVLFVISMCPIYSPFAAASSSCSLPTMAVQLNGHSLLTIAWWDLADDVGQPASSNVHDVSVGPSATGGEGTAGRPSSSGRLTSAAAAAVAHIRRRRAAAARTQDSPHLHAPPSASAGTETAGLAGPDVADSLQPHGSNVERHVQSCQPTAPTPVADPRADARAEDPRAEGLHAGAAAQSQQHQQPAESSGRSADAAEQALPGEREGLPVSTHELSMERESLPVTRHGPPPERQPSAPRPPLPFHPIRRSARLHKSGGNAASGPASSADNGNLDASHSAAADAAGVTADTFVAADSTHADANAASEPLGPCTRYDTLQLCTAPAATLTDVCLVETCQKNCTLHRGIAPPY